MENRCAKWLQELAEAERRNGEPQRIDAILEELFHQYEDRFPGVNLTLVRTPATVAA